MLHARSARAVDEVLAEIAKRQHMLRNTPPGLQSEDDASGLEIFDGAREPDTPNSPIEPAIVGGEHYDPEGFVVDPATN